MLGGNKTARKTIHQHLRGDDAELIPGLVDGGERGVGHLGKIEIVGPENRNILGAAEAGLPHGFKCAQRDHVVGADDGGGAGHKAEEQAGFDAPSFPVEGGLLNVLRSNDDLRGTGGAFESGKPLLGIGRLERTGDGREMAVSELDEIAGCLKGTPLIGYGNGVADPRPGQAVDTDDGGSCFAVRLCLFREVAGVGRNDEQARGQERSKFVEVAQLFGMIVVGIAEDEAVTVGKGNVFRAAYEGREERVGDIGDDHADEVGLDFAQTAGELTGLVTGKFHGFENALPQRLSDNRRAVENIGDGAERTAGALRNLLHVGQLRLPCLSVLWE